MTKVTVDHNEIRSWAEEHGARPATVKGSGIGNTIGKLELDFEGDARLQHVEWSDWFKVFDDRRMAAVLQKDEDGFILVPIDQVRDQLEA